ncbi:MAG: hypothetical protein ACM3SO_24485 [Betaproteobacteria bacterium]
MASGALRRCKAVRVAFLLLAGMTAAHAEEGLVVDAVTGTPISGVFVVAEWRGEVPRPVEPAGGCYEVALTRTGNDGRFHVDLNSANLNPMIINRERLVTLFKPGYEIKEFFDAVEKRTELRPFTGTFAKRFKDYNAVWARECPEASARLLPLVEAIHAEAEALARTPAEREKVAGFQLQLDTYSMGHDAAYRRYLETLKRIKQPD